MARRSGITEIKQKSTAKWVLINGIKFNEREEIQRCHHERDLKCFFSVSALEKKAWQVNSKINSISHEFN
jgi:hypothetical protein